MNKYRYTLVWKTRPKPNVSFKNQVPGFLPRSLTRSPLPVHFYHSSKWRGDNRSGEAVPSTSAPAPGSSLLPACALGSGAPLLSWAGAEGGSEAPEMHNRRVDGCWALKACSHRATPPVAPGGPLDSASGGSKCRRLLGRHLPGKQLDHECHQLRTLHLFH